ncbi:putative Insulin-like growth factor-binding protein complex acid labile subunit [Hypsibius exemplaris]|uniref:Insulin-like growth factor-binding protein complex acid labile subunit n=1 Tax=Hypsibius exemplaris TaxID=2072580 RepID=A0A1W0WBV0_HYPEX|nr:putative Insulin-like growth factor-binding protein complex acid labile subunit [Hypsibius exemplaris]
MRPFFFLFFPTVCVQFISAQCPPKDARINCDCVGLDGELDRQRVVCSGVKLTDVADLFRNVGPLDLTLQNGSFSSLSGEFFSTTNVGKLTLINNGIERISVGDLKGATLRELTVSEPGLRSVDDLALNDVPSVQRFSLSDSTVLERFPKLKGLPNLDFVAYTNNSVRFLEAGTLSELPALRDIDLRRNKIEIFDISTFGDHLDRVRRLDLTGNAIADLSFLPLVLRQLPSLNFLFLQGNKIARIPSGMLDGLNAILTVDLSRNEIITLPDAISTNASSTLRELYLGHNYIAQIPPAFFQHIPNLRTLSFANNSLNVIDTELAPLKDLLYLRLEGNKLQRIASQAFTTLARLQTLSLTGNLLTVLENNVFSGTNELVTLDLSHNYIQEFRGTEMKNLTKLEILLFSGNRLRNLYAGFESLTALKRLDLSGNQISNIDNDTFASLISLETLQLDGNLFMRLPMPALERLPLLEKLTLSNNRLLRLPVLKKVGHLRTLTLDHNSIPDIPKGAFANLPELRQLLLNANQISEVHEDSFANLFMLYVLDLSDNLIQTLPPKVLDNLVSLETISLAHNDLYRLEDGTLGNLPMLRSADFSHNQIAIISEGAFTKIPHLTQFDLSWNGLNRVPLPVSKLEKVRKLDLSHNRIRRIEDADFGALEKLENLYLQRNPLCLLSDKAFSQASGLNYIDLSHTDLHRVPETAFRPKQDFSSVVLDGVSVDCDCNSKWLRLLKPNVRCGSPTSVMEMKLADINPDFMTCAVEDKAAADRCTVLPVTGKLAKKNPPSVGDYAAPSPPSPVSVTPAADPDTQLLAKGSIVQAWPTRAELEAKALEMDAIQSARQTAAMNGGLILRCSRSLTTLTAYLILLSKLL